MPQIRLDNVSFGYVDPLFSEITMTISDNDRVGIVGNNGSGKSSLLRCIAGELEPTSGNIIRPKRLKFGFIEQDIPSRLRDKELYDVIAEAIPEHDRSNNLWKVDIALDTFKAPQDIRDKPIKDLSGGWQRLALIARTGVGDPDFLLLDEPTNHLDLEKMFVLESWINEQLQGTPIICVSHDRTFLDNCTNKTLFVRSTRSASYDYSYSRARELLENDDEAAQAQRSKELKEISRLEKNSHTLRQMGVNYRSGLLLRKSIQLAARAERIKAKTTEVYVDPKRQIELSNSGTQAKRILALKDVDVTSPDGTHLFHIESLYINQGETVVILGVNGSGKSQFLELLRRSFADIVAAKDQGISVGPSIKLGYLDQQLSQLPLEKTLKYYIAEQADMTPQTIVSRLVEAGFPYADQDKKIKLLSYGEKSRVALLALRLAEPNFYIMDEPTNHLDISGQEQIEQEIIARQASCVLVSHDRSFVENLGTKFYVIHNKELREIDSPDVFYKHLLEGTPMFTPSTRRTGRSVDPKVPK